jgi:hypothetical protein
MPEVGLAVAPDRVERADVGGPGQAAERAPEAGAHVEEDPGHIVVPVHVVVRVDVRGQGAGELDEEIDLTFDLAGHGLEVGARHGRARAGREVRVQAEAQRGEGASPAHAVLGGGQSHHEARAGQHAPGVRLDDAAIDPLAHAEVVGIDDEAPRRLPGGPGRDGQEGPGQPRAQAQEGPARESAGAVGLRGATSRQHHPHRSAAGRET